MASVSIKNFTRERISGEIFSVVAHAVLPRFDISLAFVGPARARALNTRLRGKDYTPNVLSYALSAHDGEIIICLAEARRQAPKYGMDEQTFILYLFIHGLLHLKGRVHGATMEKCEQKLLATYATSGGRTLPNVTKNRHRNRHRHTPDKSGGRRGIR